MADMTAAQMAEDAEIVMRIAKAIYAAERSYFSDISGVRAHDWDELSLGVRMTRMSFVIERLLGQRAQVNCISDALEAGIVAAIARMEYGVEIGGGDGSA